MRNPVRAVAAAAATAGLVLLAGPAFAHVTVDPGEAEQGGYATLTFRVPTESDTASTTKIEVALPPELTSARVKPHPGWTYALARSGDTVTAITWTAGKDGAIKPGEFDEFDISVGPLPKTDSLTFKTLQTYSDGTVVRWIDPPAAEGQPEPEHPAPTLTLVPTSDEDTASHATADAGDDEGDDGDGTSTTALVLSIVAVVLGAGALGVSLLRRRTEKG